VSRIRAVDIAVRHNGQQLVANYYQTVKLTPTHANHIDQVTDIPVTTVEDAIRYATDTLKRPVVNVWYRDAHQWHTHTGLPPKPIGEMQ
jgi:hypothetical protein